MIEYMKKILFLFQRWFSCVFVHVFVCVYGCPWRIVQFIRCCICFVFCCNHQNSLKWINFTNRHFDSIGKHNKCNRFLFFFFVELIQSNSHEIAFISKPIIWEKNALQWSFCLSFFIFFPNIYLFQTIGKSQWISIYLNRNISGSIYRKTNG